MSISYIAQWNHNRFRGYYLPSNKNTVSHLNGMASPLMIAIAMGELGIVVNLLERGEPIDGSDKNGRTPLMVAVEQKNTAAFDLLMKHRANFHLRGSNIAQNGKVESITVLRLARMKGQGNMVMILEKAGAPE